MDGERVQPGVQRPAYCRCSVQTLSTESLESGESKSLSSQESLLSQWFEMPLFHIVPMSFPAPQKMRAEECREKWQSRCTFCQVGHELAIKYNDKSPLENMLLEFDSNSLKFSMQLLPCKPHSSVMSLWGTALHSTNCWENLRRSCSPIWARRTTGRHSKVSGTVISAQRERERGREGGRERERGRVWKIFSHIFTVITNKYSLNIFE